jgi:hypothetical protein
MIVNQIDGISKTLSTLNVKLANQEERANRLQDLLAKKEQ